MLQLNHTPLQAFPPSLVLRHSTGRRAMPIPTVHHDRRLPPTALHLLLHIWAVLDILPEIADVASDFLVRLEREWDYRDKAECEPLPVFFF